MSRYQQHSAPLRSPASKSLQRRSSKGPAAKRGQGRHFWACDLRRTVHSCPMPSAWKIIVRKRPKEIGGASAPEFYLVALPEKEAAVAVLRMREGDSDGELEVTGEAAAESIDWLDIKPGQIFVCGQLSDD